MWLRARSIFAAILAGSALFVAADSCTKPTYVTLKLTTDVPCERLRGVSITTGVLGSLEDKPATTVTNDCAGDTIGTLTVTPSGDDDSEFGVLVVAGLERAVESCRAPDYGDGCIVARRGLRYVADKSLNLPIILRQICNGIPCGPFDTCVKGVCLPAKVDDPNKCESPDGCSEEVLVTQQTENDAGVGGVDGSSDGGGGVGPVVALSEYCGTASPIDLNAPWPMRIGCPTGARRASVVGPKRSQLVTTPTLLDPGQFWSDLVIGSSGRGYGNRRPDNTNPTINLASFDLLTAGSFAQAIGAQSRCMAWTDGMHCFSLNGPDSTTWNANTMTGSATFPATFSGSIANVGSSSRIVSAHAVTLDGGGGAQLTFETYDANGVFRISSSALPEQFASPPRGIVMSKDGTQAYFTTAKEIGRYDLTTAALRTLDISDLVSTPVVTDDDEVLAVTKAGLRRFDKDLVEKGTAIPLVDAAKDTLASAVIGLGRSGGVRQAYVGATLTGSVATTFIAVRYQVTPPAVAWTAKNAGTNFIIGADDVVYIAESTTLQAVKPGDGTVLWTQTLPFLAGEMAIGKDSSLFVSIGSNLFKSAP